MSASEPKLGFIGQGFVGKNYADSFEDRGFSVIRYSKEEAYSANREMLREADIIFIAVPTPTTPDGVDLSILQEVMQHVRPSQTVVIKSTIPLGTTEELQREYPDHIILHNPEFLREKNARKDVDEPIRTVIGMGADTEKHRAAAQRLLHILPKAPFDLVTDARTAEFIKYTHNTYGYALIVFANILYDLAKESGAAWDAVRDSISHNPWVPEKYLDPVHQGGRGAGGHCFIKDFAAFREMYERTVDDENGLALLKAFENKNNDLLIRSKKDLDLLRGVYGENYQIA